ncbi:transcriptional regulator [Pseudoalteromonas aliena]|uniref:Transcriptional regulator n=1 Tax=Pseudoalteromonas aliena TaxID=247523 RepID=A0A1Q2H0A9_9GAMM|nr:helix-turn-helix domain-containing protein [Pseudoalteromonas aliena]AQQ00786.1 transcriptional regulator [Pseudoalteromonas aliena]
MNNSKTALLNRKQLQQLILQKSIKHLWLANQIGVSEKTLTRWLNGSVSRIRLSNLTKLAHALSCTKEDLIARSEIDIYPSEENRDILVNELHNDGLLYELMMSSKIKLAISLIKSTFHSTLPRAIIANFYIKLGYASLIHRQYKNALQYFEKGFNKATKADDLSLVFSANLGCAITLFFSCEFKKSQYYLAICSNSLQYANQEKAHYYSTYSLFNLYSGDINAAIQSANLCLTECGETTDSIEKNLFKGTALQLLGACYLLKGDTKAAYTFCAESLNVANLSGYNRCVAVSKGYLAAIHCTNEKTALAEQLIEQSIALVSDEDISLPSLLCIALYIYRKTANTTKFLACLSTLNAMCNTTNVVNTFATYQLYLIDIEQGNTLAASEKLTQIESALNQLSLPLWLAWLTKPNL